MINSTLGKDYDGKDETLEFNEYGLKKSRRSSQNGNFGIKKNSPKRKKVMFEGFRDGKLDSTRKWNC